MLCAGFLRSHFTKLGLIFALVATSTGFAADGKMLRVRADSWMPFNGEPTSENPGYVVELLREIFAPAGVQVDYQIMPWPNALKAAETGEIDAVIGANKKEAANLAVGAESIAEPRYALFVRRDSSWKYESLRSLRTVKLGAIKGYSYWDSLDSYIEKGDSTNLKLYTGDTPLMNAFADLSTGKIDVVVESVLVFYWAAKNSGRTPSDFRMAYSETADPLYVAFSPTEQGRRFARIFDLGWRDLQQRGRIDAIFKKYGLEKK